MFDKTNKKKSDPFGKINRIAEGTIMEGNITSQADFRLDGELIGNFKSTGKVVIGATGKITGDIICVNADIEGKFIGRIEVSETLNIKEKATIEGDAIVGKLSVEPGANFTATCVMKDSIKDSIKDSLSPMNRKEDEKSGKKTV